MDRLAVGQKLQSKQELISNSGWFRLKLFPNGQLAVYRTQASLTIWVSPGISQPAGSAIMQADGNFVALSAQNAPYWATGTGHPGATIVMQDDGNLVVYDAANKALWATNTVQDRLSPTIRYTESCFLFNSPITAVSRSADKLDIFGTDLGGAVLTAAWQPTFDDGWHGWWPVAGGQSLPSAVVTAVSRSADKEVDIFVVGVNGLAITAAWDAAVSPIGAAGGR